MSDAAQGAAVRRRFKPGTTVDDLKAYMAPYVAHLGYRFNDDAQFVDLTLGAEIDILDATGDVYCPCRIRTGDPKQDARIVCPCIVFHSAQFAAMRKCWCGLFVRTDVEDGAALHGVVGVPPGPVDVRVAAVDDLREGEVRRVKAGTHDIAVVRAGDGFFALSDVCRHAFAPLSDGWVEDHVLVCPWHGWRYDVRDGTTDHPDSDVRVFPVTVRDGEVFVTLPEAGGPS